MVKFVDWKCWSCKSSICSKFSALKCPYDVYFWVQTPVSLSLQLGLQKTYWFCWVEESRCYVLYEFTVTNSFLHQQTTTGKHMILWSILLLQTYFTFLYKTISILTCVQCVTCYWHDLNWGGGSVVPGDNWATLSMTWLMIMVCFWMSHWYVQICEATFN